MKRRDMSLRLRLRALAFAVMPAMSVHAEPLIVRKAYQDTTEVTSVSPPTPGDCHGVSGCVFIFSKVKAGKLLTVTNVSCDLNVSAGQVSEVAIRNIRKTAVQPYIHFLTPNPAVGSKVLLNNATVHLVRQQRRPMVVVFTTEAADISGACAISGRLKNMP